MPRDLSAAPPLSRPRPRSTDHPRAKHLSVAQSSCPRRPCPHRPAVPRPRHYRCSHSLRDRPTCPQRTRAGRVSGCARRATDDTARPPPRYYRPQRTGRRQRTVHASMYAMKSVPLSTPHRGTGTSTPEQERGMYQQQSTPLPARRSPRPADKTGQAAEDTPHLPCTTAAVRVDRLVAALADTPAAVQKATPSGA